MINNSVLHMLIPKPSVACDTDSIEVFANNTTFIMLTYLSTLCFNLGEIMSCVWDISIS